MTDLGLSKCKNNYNRTPRVRAYARIAKSYVFFSVTSVTEIT